jgi:hypothetical protein
MFFNNEKEVEFFYWSALEKIGRQMDKNFSLTAANKTDGYFSAGSIKAICEIKHGLDFSSASNVARVIIQALYYIKNRQKAGLESPSSIFVGDDSQYFIVSVKQFSDLLDGSYSNEMDPKWEISPSGAYKQNTKLFQQLFVRQIPLMIKKLDDRFDAEFVRNRLVALASNENIKTKLNADSIKKPFHYFTQSVLIGGESIKDHVKIKLFFAAITGSEDAIYLRGRVRFEGKDYPVNDSYYAGFVNVYQTKYKTSERESFVASMDNLIKEEARRFHGAYFTPKVLVDYAHETISKQLGDKWRDEYVVWDPAAGTLNLTRDYQFRELYCSTLFQEELDLASDYNPEAVKFQFDFLNDEFKAQKEGGKIPDGLFEAVTNKSKKILILMNPPYANTGTGQGTSSAGTAKSVSKNISPNAFKKEMSEADFGRAAKDLYIKFIYRSSLFTDKGESAIFMFTPTGFMRNTSSTGVTKYLDERYEYLDSFAFDSKYFDGASGGWAISFTGWKKTTSPKSRTRDIQFIELDRENKVKLLKKIELTQVEKPYKEYVNNLNENGTVKAQLTLSMPTTLQDVRKEFMLPSDFMGSMPAIGPIKEYSGARGIFCAAYSNKGTARLNITPRNIWDAVVFNAVRSLIEPDLYNREDEFMIPDFLHPRYEEFKNDSFVLSLFDKKSYQSSLRKVGYDAAGKPINYPTFASKGTINVYNEWFFLSHQEIVDLADENDFSELYQDTKGQKDRNVHLELERLIVANKLSPEALAVLEAGRKLFRDTFPIRAKLHSQFPEYHLNAWDAGYWQLRTALERAGMASQLEDLKSKYEALESRMRPLVYELGFLKGSQ